MEGQEIEFCNVELEDGISLQARLFKPTTVKSDIVIVLVHQYSVLGGCQGLMKGIAKGLAEKGYRTVTFDMRGVGRSSGKASWTGSSEVQDVIAVCKWASQHIPTGRILLVGSSAGTAEAKGTSWLSPVWVVIWKIDHSCFLHSTVKGRDSQFEAMATVNTKLGCMWHVEEGVEIARFAGVLCKHRIRTHTCDFWINEDP